MKVHDEHGGSLVEFAIIAPLLFVILFGIIEFGILLYDKAMITNASREGARSGIVFTNGARTSDADIKKVVKDYLGNGSYLISFGAGSTFNDGNILISETVEAAGRPTLKVTVNYQFQFLAIQNLLAFFGGGFENPRTLSAVTVMRLE